jgi:hypothetical protein
MMHHKYAYSAQKATPPPASAGNMFAGSDVVSE